MTLLPFLVAGWLFVVGLYGVVTSRNLVHLAVCLSVVQSSTYVLLLAVGYRDGGSVAIFQAFPDGSPVVDPIVAALVLTDIVVSATVTALLLAIAVRVHRRTGSCDPADLLALQG